MWGRRQPVGREAVSRARDDAAALDLDRRRNVVDHEDAGGGRMPVNEEPPAPFGGFKCSSNGGHFGGVGQLELWTEWQWLTSRDSAGQFPF